MLEHAGVNKIMDVSLVYEEHALCKWNDGRQLMKWWTSQFGMWGPCCVLMKWWISQSGIWSACCVLMKWWTSQSGMWSTCCVLMKWWTSQFGMWAYSVCKWNDGQVSLVQNDGRQFGMWGACCILIKGWTSQFGMWGPCYVNEMRDKSVWYVSSMLCVN